MRARLGVLVAMVILLSACHSLAAKPADIGAMLRTRIAEAYVQPFRAGDVARWVDVFADDALAYHDGPPAMKGREAIRAFGELVHTNFKIEAFDVVVDEVRYQDDWALTAGHYRAEFLPRNTQAYRGAAGPRQGKFMFVWERRDGVWRIIADMGNSTDPAPPR